MIAAGVEQIAAIAGAQLLLAGEAQTGPEHVVIDSRQAGAGALFVGLRGEREDGGAYAQRALAAGAWGVLVGPEHARAAAAAATGRAGAVLAHNDPLGALQALATAWREQLGRAGAKVVAVTGSTGKTSTKDILAALLAPLAPTACSPANLNTEIGLPLAILQAPVGTRVLVLEMGMRGRGQIAELAAIARPDVGVIVNIGPAHLEQLGSLEGIAAAKAELIAGLRAGAVAVVPAGEPLLGPHLREDVQTVTFGEAGDVRLLGRERDGRVRIAAGEREIELRPSFSQPHQLQNLLAAVAAARALGYEPSGELRVEFTAMRGQREELPDGIVLIDDCYNANPMSMRSAIDELSATAVGGRRVAVLGDMLELGPEAVRLHGEVGAHAREQGVDLLIAVGALAAGMLGPFGGEAFALADAREATERVPALLREGDTVLVKASRGMGLERVADALRNAATGAGGSGGAKGSGAATDAGAAAGAGRR